MDSKEDFKKPLNVVFLFLAIASLALSVFLYFNGKKTRNISYQIDEPSNLIYDSKNSSSKIKVILKDSIAIKDNVYLLSGVIWNDGDLPISKEDVRQTLMLTLTNTKEILDFKIVKQTYPDIAKFRLSQINSKSLVLDWKYFDPDFAFKFQIIYTGYNNARLNLTGKILDVKSFKQKFISEHTGRSFNILLGIETLLASLLLIYTVVRRRRAGPRYDKLVYMCAAVFTMCIILCLFIIFHKNFIPLAT